MPRHEFVQELSLWKTEGYEQNSITLVAMLSTDSDSGESAASAACGMDGEVACRGSWTSAQPLDLHDPGGAVAAGTAQHDAHDPPSIGVGDGSEHGIDRRAHAMDPGALVQPDVPRLDTHVVVRWRDIDAPGRDEITLPGKFDAQLAMPAQDFWQEACAAAR